MALGSRKRKRPGGRNVSPPLAPSPLLTRNLQLLPVGLTQLPNDEAFVAQLRLEVDGLLSTFAEASLIKVLSHNEMVSQSQQNEAGPSSQTVEAPAEGTAQHAESPFSVFAQIWQQKGWHYVQFTFADHNDSKRAIGDAICRVLLEHLEPYVTQSSKVQDGAGSLAFANLRQLFKVMAVPFALYLFWSTQIYPTSGIGVKHCRPAMERIPIEQNYYDVLVDLPEAVLEHLNDEGRTATLADAMSADLIEVMCRLVGQPVEEQHVDEKPHSAPASPHTKPSGRSKGKQARKDDAGAGDCTSKHGPEPVFDIIPASSLATRMPRNWPSVRVMSSLEANKEFGRIGTIVRISPVQAGSTMADETSQASTSESREVVAGLSRGDVVRLKARQRLAIAESNISRLRSQQSGRASINTDPTSNRVAASEILAQTALDVAQPAAPTRAARYQIETPRWIASAKYTSRLQPWLEPIPMQHTQQRASSSKERYREARDRIMQAGGATTNKDYGEWILQRFREKRRALQSQHSADAEEAAVQELPDINETGTLSLDSLYRLAAERTKAAAVERGEMLKSARAGASRSK